METGTDIPKPTEAELKALDLWEQQEFARQDLTQFCCYVDPAQAKNYLSRHLDFIAGNLNEMVAGGYDRLFLTCPPRHWKSSLVSEKFVLKYIADNPTHSVILASHAESLALKFSRTIRNTIVANERFHELYPDIRLIEGIGSVAEWAVEGAYRATLRAIGTGGSPVGGGADLIVVDDPVANFKQVSSPENRQALLDWYLNDLRDRLEPNGKIIMVMSRWHEGDLAGQVMKMSKSGDGEQWREIRLPAMSEGKGDLLGRDKDEALWPERWPLDILKKIKLGQGSRAFASKYQGTPRVEDGSILDSRKLVMVDADKVPKRFEKIVRRWDLAFSDNKNADYVAGAKVALDNAGNRWILHIKRIHGRWTASKPEIIRVANQDGQICVCAIEANGTQLGYYQEMSADVRMANLQVVADKPEGSKEMRASNWGTRLDDGIIYCVRGEWNQELFDEMDYFPNGENDDCIDAVSGAWKIIGETGHAPPQRVANVEVKSIGFEMPQSRRRGVTI